MIRHVSVFERLQPIENPGALSRRSWLAGTMLYGIGAVTVARGATDTGEDDGDAGEAEEIADVQSKAKKAGLEPFAHSRTKHFLCLGNAPAKFRGAALEICESLAESFLAYFRERGFKVAFPAHRLTVIALKDDASYRAYINRVPDDLEGGHYDLDANRLVMFDFRPKKSDLAAAAERINLLCLIHETTHLLCFNTGLLSLKADVPACISEGLATYVELWQPKGKRKIGGKNEYRLDALLIAARQNAESWIPIADILADDDVCEGAKTVQRAYAESWLLVHYLIKTVAQLVKFKAYLAEIPVATGAAKRLEYAEARLGSLKTLDREVKRYAQKMMR